MTRALATLTLAAVIHVARSPMFRDVCGFLAMVAFGLALSIWLPSFARADETDPDWTYELVVMAHTDQHGKHTATIAGPGRSGPLRMSAQLCLAAAVTLTQAGSSASCVPFGMGEDIHTEN